MFYKGDNYSEGYSRGVYRKAPSDVYILDVDTAYGRTKFINRFVIQNGYIEGYRKNEQLLKSRIRKSIMWWPLS